MRFQTTYDDQSFVVAGRPEKREVPVVDFDGAVQMMMARADQEPGVFWDRGWGHDNEPLMISIILGGNGKQPIGFVSRCTYDRLLREKVIGPNILVTFKARRWHLFLGETSEVPDA